MVFRSSIVPRGSEYPKWLGVQRTEGARAQSAPEFHGPCVDQRASEVERPLIALRRDVDEIAEGLQWRGIGGDRRGRLPASLRRFRRSVREDRAIYRCRTRACRTYSLRREAARRRQPRRSATRRVARQAPASTAAWSPAAGVATGSPSEAADRAGGTAACRSRGSPRRQRASPSLAGSSMSSSGLLVDVKSGILKSDKWTFWTNH